MSDERLRELERRWKLTASAEDEAAYLLERLRTADLKRTTLELVSLLGHPAAALGLGSERHVVFLGEGTEALPDWCQKVQESTGWGQEAYARAALAAFDGSPWFREELVAWRTFRPEDQRSEEAIRCLEAWVLCPCKAHQRELRSAGRQAEVARRDPDSLSQEVDFFNGYLLSVWEATRQQSLYDLLHGLADPTGPGHCHMAESVGEELSRWLLGYSDPVRERVEEALREAGSE